MLHSDPLKHSPSRPSGEKLQSTANYLRRINECRERADLAAARQVAIVAIEAHPKDPAILIESAKLHRDLGMWAGAVDLASQAASYAGTTVPILCEQGLILRQAGQFENSTIVLCRHALSSEGAPEILAHLAWGVVYQLQKDGLSRDVRAELAQLQRRSSVGDLATQALVDLALFRLRFSVQDILRVVTASPAVAVPLAMLLLRNRYDELTSDDLDTLVRSSAIAPNMLAHLYRELHGTSLGGDEFFDLVVAAGRHTPELFVSVAHVVRDTTSKSALLDRAVEEFPLSSWARQQRARANLPAATKEMKVEDMKRAVELSPDSLPLALEYLELVSELAECATALHVTDPVLAVMPECAELLLARARLYQRLGSTFDEERSIRLAFSANRGDPEARLAWALLQWRRGKATDALEMLRSLRPHGERFLKEEIRVLAEMEQSPDEQPWSIALASELSQAAVSMLTDPADYWRLARFQLRAGEVRAAIALVMASVPELEQTEPKGKEFVSLVRESLRVPEAELPRAPGSDIARELTAEGLANVARRNPERAALCFTLAWLTDRRNGARALNAGFYLQFLGLSSAAEQVFAGISRVYPDDMRQVGWPIANGRPWPWAVSEPIGDVKKGGPRITVITPSFNQGVYIEETILSVLNQQYDNLQYIVVDGGSTDETREVLERYREKIDHLIIEPDNGQTHAINKGLRIADGELVTWLNSDDIFGPGALHAIAERWQESKPDLLFGICITHNDYRFHLANFPAATQETFNEKCLADIFNYWMKGHYFYQPEVVFSRRILEAVGGELNESLYYSMDYELWLRFARHKARVQRVAWPVAFFRQHDKQKTNNLTDCVLEQVRLRNRIAPLAISVGREQEIRSCLGAALSKSRPRIAVVTTRFDKIFSPDSAGDLREEAGRAGFDVQLMAGLADSTGRWDLVILLNHTLGEQKFIKEIRKNKERLPIVGWFWDNHHHILENIRSSEGIDIAIAGHHFAADYLGNAQTARVESVALCTTQWSKREASTYYEGIHGAERKNNLYGGFVKYRFAEKRNRLIESLIGARDSDIYSLEESDLARYFGMTQVKRFREWASYKTSLCLPLDRDVSQRLFDALLTGQVPIVPTDMPDVDRIFSAEQQNQLPIIRLDAYTPECVRRAHRQAVLAFDKGGTEGARLRHEVALNGHMFSDRIVEILVRRLPSYLASKTSKN